MNIWSESYLSYPETNMHMWRIHANIGAEKQKKMKNVRRYFIIKFMQTSKIHTSSFSPYEYLYT